MMPFNRDAADGDERSPPPILFPSVKAGNLTASGLPAIVSFLPIALFLVILYFFFRSQIKMMAGRKCAELAKSKARDAFKGEEFASNSSKMSPIAACN